ncbi:MAG: response regulator [Planctomycetes bacterium]|nr:response regulator [Planctomycetota bacterium]
MSLGRILLVEDDVAIVRYLRTVLGHAGYELELAEDGASALSAAAARPPDLVLLDLGLPDMDGQQVLEGLREWTRIPVVVLSARDQERAKVAALDAGADDYLTKPFSTGELMARLRVALRHSPRPGDERGADPAELRVGGLRVELPARRVDVDGREVRLTPIEFRLLVLLMRHPGRVLTHKILLDEVWGPDAVDEPHYVRVHMANLRRKIEVDPSQPRYLLTEQGVGYRFADG